MSSVALYLNPEAFDTTRPALMGRQSAGESFLRGYLRHSVAKEFRFWNVANEPLDRLKAHVERVGALDRPVAWIPREDRLGLGRAGVMHLPTPNLAREAWARRTVGGQTAYGITGITHTTAAADIMDSLADIMSAPIEDWDCLICTSSAVRTSVETELEAVRHDLVERLGATNVPSPRLTTIPLGINVADFTTRAEDRAAWRARLDLPDDAVVVLYVGRFNPMEKMNPLPMAMALERAAQLTGKTIAWVQAGWAGSDERDKAIHEECQRFCPSVLYRGVDGRKPDVRFSIWSVGDIFLSLSDNVQETFGLTPVEAMAAGIPCVVSDWDGYKDTVRDGIDGFRVSTYAPPAGAGGDLAYRYASNWWTYNNYVGAASQFIAVDVGEAARALARLVDSPDLRRSMGEAARLRAAEVFDWARIVPQYEALWAELNARRRAAPPRQPLARNHAPNPRRLDPFHLFGNYASEWMTASNLVAMAPGRDWSWVQTLLKASMAVHGGSALPTLKEFEALVVALSAARQMTIGDLAQTASPDRRPVVERGILWLVKYDVVTLYSRSPGAAASR
ncbi:MAG: hypothetical protein B7Y81_18540 [Caulobacter sp. 32-67-35]|nr:MAG: hypothetical protein B7Y81_18540 [Caulobacter sp. 32-67-35]